MRARQGETKMNAAAGALTISFSYAYHRASRMTAKAASHASARITMTVMNGGGGSPDRDEFIADPVGRAQSLPNVMRQLSAPPARMIRRATEVAM